MVDSEIYELTPFGLLGGVIDAGSARCAADALALYMIRQAPAGGAMGIVVQDGHLQFVPLAPAEEGAKDD